MVRVVYSLLHCFLIRAFIQLHVYTVFSKDVKNLCILVNNVLVKPSVELLLAPSTASDPQTLLCSGWGFDPEIKWLNGFEQIFTSNHDISMDANGRVAATSQLQVAQTQWKSGEVFTCEVSDKSLNEVVRKEISVCSGKLENYIQANI